MPVNIGTDLLSDDERSEIREAFKDIHATFDKTPVLYWVYKGSLDRFQEGSKTNVYDKVTLMAFVEFGSLYQKDEQKFTVSGSTERAGADVMVNVDYLDALGLWDNATNTPKMNDQTDKIFIRGREYSITEITTQGPIEDRNVYVLIKADPKPKPTM